MRMSDRLAAAISLALIVVVSALPARACSMREGYRPPTNFELLERAELVVLGRLQAEPPARVDQHGIGRMTLQPIRVLKGELPDQPLAIMSMPGWDGQPIPSLPTSLNQSHFSAGLGACVRIFYPRGGLVLVMFERKQEGWQPVWAAWARTAEDVESEDGYWVRAAQTYLALQARTPFAARRAAVERLASELEGGAPDPLRQAMARDLRHHLRVTSGADRPGDSPMWSLLNTPREAAAFIVAEAVPAARGDPPRGGAVACLSGKESLHIMVPRIDRPVEIALTLGGRRFEAQGEQVKSTGGEQLIQAEPYVEGAIPLSEPLLAAMEAPAALSGLAIGDVTIEAPPGEVLPLLAHQCRFLRGQRTHPDR